MLGTLIFRGLGSLITLLVVYLLLRVLEDGQTGYYLLGNSTILLCAVFSTCGTETIVLRTTATAYATQNYGEANSVLAKSSLLAGSIALIIATGIYFFANTWAKFVFKSDELAGALQGISPAIPAVTLQLLFARALQGRKMINWSVFTLSVCSGLLMTISILVCPPTNAAVACWYYSAATTASMLLSLILIWSTSLKSPHSVRWSTVLHSAGPSWVSVFVDNLTRVSSQFFAARFATAAAIDQLALSQRLAMVTSVTSTAANQHAAPELAAAWNTGDFAKIQKTTRHAIWMTLGLSTPLLLPMLIAPEWVLHFMSSSMSGGGQLLRISAIGQFAMIFWCIHNVMLAMFQRERSIRNATVSGGAFAMISGWILTKYFGAVGAATATTLTFLLMCIITSFMVKRLLGFHPVSLLYIRQIDLRERELTRTSEAVPQSAISASNSRVR